MAEGIRLSGSFVERGGVRTELTSAGLRGAAELHNFGLDKVVVGGWALLGKPLAPVDEVLLFAGGELLPVNVQRVARPDLESVYPEVWKSIGFRIESTPDELRPAERDLRLVVRQGDGYWELTGVRGERLLSDIRIEDETAFTVRIATPSTRVEDMAKVAYCALWALNHFDPESHSFASAVCVLGYRVIEEEARFGGFAGLVIDSHRRAQESAAGQRNLYTRWRISGALVCGLLSLRKLDYSSALSYFASVADRPEDMERSVISAFNIAVCSFLVGWLHHKAGKAPEAVRYFEKTVWIVKAGMTAQPIETNYFVAYDVANMAHIGQQALLLIGRLDAERAKELMIPSNVEVQLDVVFKRVLPLYERLPAEFKVP